MAGPGGLSWKVTLGGVDIVVTPKRVKHLRLVVNPDGRVRASVPMRTSKHDAEEFLRQHLDWVLSQRARLARQVVPAAPLRDGDTLPLWGDPLTVRLIAGRAGARATAAGVTISVPDPGDPAMVDAAVAALYRREARALLPDMVAKWSSALGRHPSRVQLRAMRTRWGSCTTTTGAIRINQDLAARHPKYLNYVVLHELTHLLEPGHGPGFQAVMDAQMPEWRVLRSELNARGKG